MRSSIPEDEQDQKFAQLPTPDNNGISSLPASVTDQNCTSRKRKAKSPDENSNPAKKTMKKEDRANWLQMTDSLQSLIYSYAESDSDEEILTDEAASPLFEPLSSEGQFNIDKDTSCQSGSNCESIFLTAFHVRINDNHLTSSTKNENSSSVQRLMSTDESSSTADPGARGLNPPATETQSIDKGVSCENDPYREFLSTKEDVNTNGDNHGSSSKNEANIGKNINVQVAGSSHHSKPPEKEDTQDEAGPSNSEPVYNVVEFTLNKEFRVKNGSNESIWNDSFDAAEVSLMRTEFLPVRDPLRPLTLDNDYVGTSTGYSLPSVIILDKRVNMIDGTEDVSYWVKQNGKMLNNLDWFDPKDIGKDLQNSFDKREQVVEAFAKNLRKRMGKKYFEKECPHWKYRKDFLKKGAGSAWRLKLREIETYWNSIISSTGQAEVYIEDWSGFSVKDHHWDFDIGTCPKEFNPSNRRVLNFQYLVQNSLPHHLAHQLFDYERTNPDDITYSCKCKGECGNGCNCDKYSFVKMTKSGATCKNEENPLYTPCGLLCSCPPECKRRLLLGRQEPLIVFYTGKRGWGVFTTRKVKRGTFMGIYTGELKVHHNEDTTYQFIIPTILKEKPGADNEKEVDFSLESACAGNEFSLINHTCENINVRTFHLANKNRFNLHDIGFVTIKALEAEAIAACDAFENIYGKYHTVGISGEELLYNYFQQGGTGTKDICWCSPKCPNKHFPLP